MWPFATVVTKESALDAIDYTIERWRKDLVAAKEARTAMRRKIEVATLLGEIAPSFAAELLTILNAEDERQPRT